MNQPPALAGIARHYPEETFFLGQVFKDTTNSYKLVWFLALLSLLKRSDVPLRMTDVFAEMVVAASASGLPLQTLARTTR